MDNRRYTLNQKALAVTRLLTPNADKRWDYIHVSPKGVTCTDTMAIARVTLPQTTKEIPSEPRIFTRDIFEKLDTSGGEWVQMPEGREAKTDGEVYVPNFDAGIPTQGQIASITINARSLITLLQTACEVTEHPRSMVRLRILGTHTPVLRVDTHRGEGEQEFVGALMSMTYNGDCIPGESIRPGVAVSETVVEKRLLLPLMEGRKFRK